MKIAMLTGVPPLPTTEGMRFRAAGVASALAKLGDLEIHVLTSAAPAEDDLRCSRRVFHQVYSYLTEGVIDEGVVAKLRRRFDSSWIVGRIPQLRPDDRQQLLTRLSDADAIWVHTLHIADTVGKFHWDRTVLDFDDLVSE